MELNYLIIRTRLGVNLGRKESRDMFSRVQNFKNHFSRPDRFLHTYPGTGTVGTYPEPRTTTHKSIIMKQRCKFGDIPVSSGGHDDCKLCISKQDIYGSPYLHLFRLRRKNQKNGFCWLVPTHHHIRTLQYMQKLLQMQCFAHFKAPQQSTLWMHGTQMYT